VGGGVAGRDDGVRQLNSEQSFAIAVRAHFLAIRVTRDVISVALADACRKPALDDRRLFMPLACLSPRR
jgi:hypothetical protein